MPDKTIKATLWELLDNQPPVIISGWDLFDLMLPLTGQNTYPQNLIKYAKDYCDRAGGSFECVNRAESKYLYTPGVKIAGSLSGKE